MFRAQLPKIGQQYAYQLDSAKKKYTLTEYIHALLDLVPPHILTQRTKIKTTIKFIIIRRIGIFQTVKILIKPTMLK